MRIFLKMAFVIGAAILVAFWLFFYILDRTRLFWQVVGDWCWEILSNLDSCAKYDFLGRPVITRQEKVAGEMDRRIKELHKIMYCVVVIKNPPLTDKKIKERFTALAKIERKNPGMVKWYSPTKVAGFDEEKAKAAYGGDRWLIVKNTLSLSIPEQVSVKTDQEFFQSIVAPNLE